ncbi:MAG TPA: LysM peptidoglycan-binding domain-containing M23 family metallopeptidase [Ktedonobacterales bacterium]|jgi:murein DD-endopeptidase MepM/ murein hydrolase activator NlpD|nr:LysM peptidoglycan-binding domain-containing M23 family metallopeptidase [Ktedonobacterales bacterium]
MGRNRKDSSDTHRQGDWDESGRHVAADGDSAEYDAYDDDDEYARSAEYSERGLALRESYEAPAVYEEKRKTAPVLIPGGGVSMGELFLKRRERPLTMRIAVITLLAVVIVTGLVSVTPLGAAAQPSVSSFEALSGAVVLGSQPGFFWYTARWNDTPEALAKEFNVQVGGIFQMNGLCPGQELQIGKQYKIPTNSQYGSNYESNVASCGGRNPAGYYGQTVFGTEWYNSYAGTPTEEGRCSSAYGSYRDFKFISPNWNSGWVRGFSFFHDGVDIAAAQGNPIHAVQDGQVIWAGYDGTNGFGWSVVINHCNHVSSLYGHMMSLPPGLKAGDNVSQGDVIGYEGSTGWSTGPHLHISVDWNNVPIDPMLFYQDVYHITHDVPFT